MNNNELACCVHNNAICLVTINLSMSPRLRSLLRLVGVGILLPTFSGKLPLLSTIVTGLDWWVLLNPWSAGSFFEECGYFQLLLCEFSWKLPLLVASVLSSRWVTSRYWVRVNNILRESSWSSRIRHRCSSGRRPPMNAVITLLHQDLWCLPLRKSLSEQQFSQGSVVLSQRLTRYLCTSPNLVALCCSYSDRLKLTDQFSL